MTFDEAIILKKEHSEPFVIIDDSEFEIMVMPANRDDYLAYQKYITAETFAELTDEYAREFSSDGEFVLGGISVDPFSTIQDIRPMRSK